MTISMYSASVPALERALGALDAILDRLRSTPRNAVSILPF